MSPLWTLNVTLLTLLGSAAACGKFKTYCAPGFQRPRTDVPKEEVSRMRGGGYVNVRYGTEVTITCTGDAANLTITKHGDQHALETYFNTSTVQASLQNLDLGIQVYYCKDSGTNCKDTMCVFVEPVISVDAPGVSHLPGDLWRHPHFVPSGVEYIVSCSGNDASLLHLVLETERDGWVNVNAVAVNRTTIQATVAEESPRKYGCYTEEVKRNIVEAQIIRQMP